MFSKYYDHLHIGNSGTFVGNGSPNQVSTDRLTNSLSEKDAPINRISLHLLINILRSLAVIISVGRLLNSTMNAGLIKVKSVSHLWLSRLIKTDFPYG